MSRPQPQVLTSRQSFNGLVPRDQAFNNFGITNITTTHSVHAHNGALSGLLNFTSLGVNTASIQVLDQSQHTLEIGKTIYAALPVGQQTHSVITFMLPPIEKEFNQHREPHKSGNAENQQGLGFLWFFFKPQAGQAIEFHVADGSGNMINGSTSASMFSGTGSLGVLFTDLLQNWFLAVSPLLST